MYTTDFLWPFYLIILKLPDTPVTSLTRLCIVPFRETKFAAAAGAEDALVFRGPGLSMSASATAQHIYRGLSQGRDVVVPGVVNKVSQHEPITTKLLSPDFT